MLLSIDRHNGVPAYRQIMDQVRFQVVSGALAAGDELPSTRALSAEVGLNPMTVSKAYGLLEREGVVERRPGRSLVVAEVEAYRAREGKLVELRRALVPAVQAARQLGVGREELVRTVDELFAAEPEPDEEPADTAAPEGERA